MDVLAAMRIIQALTAVVGLVLLVLSIASQIQVLLIGTGFMEHQQVWVAIVGSGFVVASFVALALQKSRPRERS